MTKTEWTKEQWLAYARANQAKLERLIHNYHPYYRKAKDPSITITAPNAEAACEAVRTIIQREVKADPVEEFRESLRVGDALMIRVILNSVWFGVPESTSSWQIDGFNECVTLLEAEDNTDETR
jgi:hypothetical protein